jgi:hydrogenase maturation protein HypF
MKETIDLHTARYRIQGSIQGVGFRPFVYRLAKELGIGGWVRNDPQGVVIEAVGSPETLLRFQQAVAVQAPSPARVEHVVVESMSPGGMVLPFVIIDSDAQGAPSAPIMPDVATCPECLKEVFDPQDRRYLYPFTNCTHCGPRFTIIKRIPYDRANTTMSEFAMCPRCRAEYTDPDNRRFHAQPNACPVCGPQLAWWEQAGATLVTKHEALLAACIAIRYGEVVAVKGLGGFHLMCDARSNEAVEQLRRRKHREEKPFALMFPSLQAIEAACDVPDLERSLLTSNAAPIVLLRKRRDATDIADSVAPHNPYLGCMLPHTPLHHILMRELGFPVVATSGNLSDEPICTDEDEALTRLAGIANGFLFHNRPIARHVDDSVVRVVNGREMILRRSRGYAPAPVRLPVEGLSTLAVGAHLKSTVAVNIGNAGFISQHIGDLETQPAFRAFEEAVDALQSLYDLPPQQVACDQHPDYMSTSFARRLNRNLVHVQHHHAHIAACMVDNELDGQVLGVSWDGTGYGPDGTIWGGEFLKATLGGFQRVACLRRFRLPGGDAAVKEPRRSAVAVLYELHGVDAFARKGLPCMRSFAEGELNLLRTMLVKHVNAPLTSSAGRLFDAVAAIAGLREVSHYEGQAAMELEYALPESPTAEAYDVSVRAVPGEDVLALDWAAAIEGVLRDLEHATPVSLISQRFHNAMAQGIVEVARLAGLERVVLSGGCFQNKYLTEHTVQRLQKEGLQVFWHRRIPPNDGGIALGQLAVALSR